MNRHFPSDTGEEYYLAIRPWGELRYYRGQPTTLYTIRHALLHLAIDLNDRCVDSDAVELAGVALATIHEIIANISATPDALALDE